MIKTKNKELLNALDSLDGFFVFPSRGYEATKTSKEDRYFSIECILIHKGSKSENIFASDIFTHVRVMDEKVFYGVIETEVLKRNKSSDLEEGVGEIKTSTVMTKFIVSMDYLPFYVSKRTILISLMDERGISKGEQTTLEKFEVERFVDGWNRFNILLLLLDDFKYCGETEYQTEKFENAIRAIKYLITWGFPEKKIINWEENKILDKEIKAKLIRDAGEVVDLQFIQGNIETRFCKLVRFGFKIFMGSKNNLMVNLIKLDVIDKKSGLYLFEILKEPITDYYVTKETSTIRKNINVRSASTKREKLTIPRFVIAMRITKLKGFWEMLRKEMRQYPRITGFKCKSEFVPIYVKGKERYHFEFSNYESGPVTSSEMVEKLEDLKETVIRRSVTTHVLEVSRNQPPL